MISSIDIKKTIFDGYTLELELPLLEHLEEIKRNNGVISIVI